MNRDDIIRMAREAEGEEGLHGMWSMHVEDLERFADLVATAEREELVKLALGHIGRRHPSEERK